VGPSDQQRDAPRAECEILKCDAFENYQAEFTRLAEVSATSNVAALETFGHRHDRFDLGALTVVTATENVVVAKPAPTGS
jgi:hypothetical protein